MWVVTILKHWDSIEGTVGGLPAKLATDPADPCIGFLAVYSTREAALEAADGDASLLQEIREKEQWACPKCGHQHYRRVGRTSGPFPGDVAWAKQCGNLRCNYVEEES